MYNYKFDEDLIDKVMSSCNSSIKANELTSIIRKLDRINNELYYDKDVHKLIVESYQNSNTNAYKNVLHKISIANPHAFDHDDIQSYIDLDKKYVNQLKSLEFEIALLKVQKKKGLSNLDVDSVVRIANRISSLDDESQRINYEITNCNTAIKHQEDDYFNRLSKFIDALKESVNYVDYDEDIINTYKNYQINQLFDRYLLGMKRDEIREVLANNNLKVALGDRYGSIVKRFVSDVGADS